RKTPRGLDRLEERVVVVGDAGGVGRLDAVSHGDERDLVALGSVVFVPHEDQQRVLSGERRRGKNRGHVLAQPCVPGLHGAVVHVATTVGRDERGGWRAGGGSQCSCHVVRV